MPRYIDIGLHRHPQVILPQKTYSAEAEPQLRLASQLDVMFIVEFMQGCSD